MIFYSEKYFIFQEYNIKLKEMYFKLIKISRFQ